MWGFFCLCCLKDVLPHDLLLSAQEFANTKKFVSQLKKNKCVFFEEIMKIRRVVGFAILAAIGAVLLASPTAQSADRFWPNGQNVSAYGEIVGENALTLYF